MSQLLGDLFSTFVLSDEFLATFWSVDEALESKHDAKMLSFDLLSFTNPMKNIFWKNYKF